MQATNRSALRGPYRRMVEHYESDEIFSVSEELRFTRQYAITQLQCANWIAIGKLAKLLKRLKIKTARQLFAYGPERLINTENIGHTTLYVAMCLLDHHGYDVADWWGWTDREETRAKKPRAEVRDSLAAAAG